MLNKIKSFVIQGLTIVSALFVFIAYLLSKKVKRQEQQINDHKRNVETLNAVQEQSATVRTAKSKAEKENRTAERERQSVADSERFTGRFGSADRLRE